MSGAMFKIQPYDMGDSLSDDGDATFLLGASLVEAEVKNTDFAIKNCELGKKLRTRGKSSEFELRNLEFEVKRCEFGG